MTILGREEGSEFHKRAMNKKAQYLYPLRCVMGALRVRPNERKPG